MIAKLKGKAPYSGVMTNGFVMDERGLNFKMSKSFGNVVDPRTIIEGGNNQEAENVVLYDHLSQIDQHALFQLGTLLKTSKQVTKVISSSKYSKLSLYFI